MLTMILIPLVIAICVAIYEILHYFTDIDDKRG